MKPDQPAPRRPIEDDWRDVVARQQDEGAHDRSLLVERLAWTPEQRLAANAEFGATRRPNHRRQGSPNAARLAGVAR
jgi:hypothetical protein